MDIASITKTSAQVTLISFIVSFVCMILIVVLGLNLPWDTKTPDSQKNKNLLSIEWILYVGIVASGSIFSMAFLILLFAIIANLVVGVSKGVKDRK